MTMYYQVHFITSKPKHKYYLLFLEADNNNNNNKNKPAELRPEEIWNM